MNRSPSWLKIGLLALSLVVVVPLAMVFQKSPADSSTVDGTAESKLVTLESSTLENLVVIGGIERPASDVTLSSQEQSESKNAVKKRQGFSPSVNPDANPSVTQLVFELRDRERPSAFSSFAPPWAFDPESYKSNPEVYLTRIEPGRVFAPAQAGESVPPIRSEGKRFHRLVQGESVRLKVEVPPGAPVTFASQDLGQFENQLSSITVPANDEGIAEAVYTASGGTIDLVQILAASPMASGQLQFTVDVAVRK